MLNLGGLSAAYPGYQAAEATQATTETSQAAAKEAALKLLGQHVLGRALTGGQPDQGPQPPAPGQPSAPSAPQGGGPAPAPMQGGPAPQAPPAASAAPSGTPEITLQALTQRILATSPRVKDHPEVLMAALERAAPLLDRQSKEDLAELRKEMSTQRLAQAGELARARQESLNSWRDRQGGQRDRALDQKDTAQESLADYRKRTGDQRDAEEIGRNGRQAATEEGRNSRAGARNERTDRRLDQADEREARISKFASSREGQTLEKLDIARRSLEQRIESAKTREDRERLALELRTNHQKATEILQANSVNSSLKPLERKTLLQERAQQIEDAITRLRGKSSQPVTTAPAVTAANPDAPPADMLKEGVPQEFKNGQTWTLENGQPKRVK